MNCMNHLSTWQDGVGSQSPIRNSTWWSALFEGVTRLCIAQHSPFAGLESRGGMQKADRCSLQISGAVCLFYKELHAFPGSSDDKEFACNAGDLGSIPALGKIPWRRKWLPTPVFSPGKSLEQRSLVAYSPWAGKESDMTERLTHG